MPVSSDSDTVEYVLPSIRGRFRPHSQSENVAVDLAGLSHVGLVRPNNEDHFLTCRFDRSLSVLQGNLSALQPGRRFDECGYGMAVADGMGGKAAGEVASGMAINSLINLVLHTPDWIFRLDDDWESPEMLRRGAERFEEIGEILENAAARDRSLEGFGTTLTIAWSLGSAFHFAHVGDSRVCLLRDGRLQPLTTDHTLAQERAERSGSASQHPVSRHLRNVLTRCLGDHGSGATPDVGRHDLLDGDVILLCTDGLTDMLPDDRIAAILREDQSAQEACQQLIHQALEAGGKDNVTAIVARYRIASEDAATSNE